MLVDNGKIGSALSSMHIIEREMHAYENALSFSLSPFYCR